MKKPKIAILTLHPYNYGGVLTSVKEVYKFCSRYFEPTLFFLGFDQEISAHLRPPKLSSQVRRSKYFGMDCVEIGSRFAFWEPGHYASTIKYWRKELTGFDYFFVSAGTSIPGHPLLLLNKKFVMWVASSYDEDRTQRVEELSLVRYLLDRLGSSVMHNIEKAILNKADYVFALSNYAKKSFLKIAEPKKMVTCGHPINLKVKVPVDNSKSIIAVGRFDDPRKNIKMLLNVFSKLNDVAHLYVVGPRPSEKRLKGLDLTNVTFTGRVSSDTLDELFRTSYLMLMTSYQEGLGIVGLEAMSYGIPVISTDCGGPADYILDGFNGYIVNVDDETTMVEKTLKLLNDSDLYSKMVGESLKFIINNCSHEKIYATFKQGLVETYPELGEHFSMIDNITQQSNNYEHTSY